MIIKNEEAYLERCLSSVNKYVDEIIIVDTGSTDNSIEIARQYTNNIYDFIWNEDFSAARNFSIEKAKSDFILVLDADEYILDTQKLKGSLDQNSDYYILNIKNLSKTEVTYYSQAIRLFKNNIGLKYNNRIHEHLNIEQEGIKYSGIELDSPLIYHTGYSKEVYNNRNKSKRNLLLLEREIKENPSGYTYFNLGKQYKIDKNYKKALENLKAAYYKSKNMNYLNELLYHMVDCLRHLKRYNEALKLVDDSLEVFPFYIDLQFVKARILEEMGYLTEAEKSYHRCIDLKKVESNFTYEGVGDYLAYFQLSKIHSSIGNNVKTIEFLYKSLNQNKYYFPSLISFLSTLEEKDILEEQTIEYLIQIYDFSLEKDQHIVIKAAYITRNKLLATILKKFNLAPTPEIEAISYQYSHEYAKAVETWENVKINDKENLLDIFLLTLLQKEKRINLISKINGLKVLSTKECKLLDQICNCELNDKAKISQMIIDLLIEAVGKLIVLKEYDKAEYISDIILSQGNKNKVKLAEIFKKHSFYNEAIVIIDTKIDQGFKPNYISEIRADILYSAFYYNEALVEYFKVLNSNMDSRVLSKLYYVYQSLNDEEGKRLVQNQISELLNVPCN
jgi:glycosyltransferase involved in cell wall biosynthesis